MTRGYLKFWVLTVIWDEIDLQMDVPYTIDMDFDSTA